MNASGRTAIVVGASRGLGHGIATALADSGAQVIAVSRTGSAYPEGVRAEVVDAGDAGVPASLLDRHDPDVVVIVAGATPHMLPLHEQTWETFAVNWETDVRLTFHWLREALRKPLRPGSRVIVVSSGAALNANGSPLSGGYAGAKATQRFIAGYARDEAERAGLGITVTVVYPFFAPATGVGAPAVAAYAARAGLPLEQFLAQQPSLLTPEIAGAAVVELVRLDAGDLASGYRLSGDGLQPATA
jgi:3-oxoacyl-[acyl-carrier protein] reductase